MDRIRIETTTCRRCGQKLATASRSLLGLDQLKAQWRILCSHCITPEERHNLLIQMGEALAQKRRRAQMRNQCPAYSSSLVNERSKRKESA